MCSSLYFFNCQNENKSSPRADFFFGGIVVAHQEALSPGATGSKRWERIREDCSNVSAGKAPCFEMEGHQEWSC